MAERDQPGVLRFGAYQADLRAGEVRKNGVLLRIQERPFRALALLAGNPGRVVTREEMRRELWPEDVFVDFEHGINSTINRLREALNDSAENPQFIQTVGGRGYRFIAPVESVPAGNDGLKPAATGDERASRGGAERVRARWLRLAAMTVAVLLAAAAAAYFGWRRFRRPAAPAPRIMLAVLPFENLSGDPAQDYLSDGFTEETITQLGRLNPARFGVIARTSSMTYKNTAKTTAQIGRELGVGYILEGSIRRAGDRVRVSAQLIRARDQTHLWARDYDRNLGDLLAVEGEVAQAIVARIELQLASQRRTQLANARPLNPDAYEAYLRGRYFWNKRDLNGFNRAKEYFQQAIQKDPGYAQAYSGLADTYLLIGGYNYASQAETIPQARAAAQKALELDPSLAEARASLGLIAMNYDWDWGEAEREYKMAIRLGPNYPTAHHWYAEYLSLVGRFPESFAEIKRAQELDPFSVIIQSDAGKYFYMARQYDRAIKQLQDALDMNPNFASGYLYLVLARAEEGQFDEAIADTRRLERIDDSYLPPALLGYAYAAMGRKKEAEVALTESRQRVKHGPGAPALWALAYGRLGKKDEAFALLEQEFRARGTGMTSLKVNPAYDPLRSDPRFTDLLRRVGLAH